MNESVPSRADEAPDAPARKPYQAPALVCYGKVAALTQGGSCNASNDSGTAACTGPGTMTGVWASDRALKTNIVRVGDHPLGFGLYLFDYKPEHQAEWGSGRRFGVMADEVERVRPDAVMRHADGYRVVAYGRIGIDLRQ
jgi:hypothetical protein